MEDDLAEEIQLKVCDDSGIVNGVAPSLVVEPNDRESLPSEPAPRTAVSAATARIPFRIPKLFIGVLVFGLLQVSMGVYLKYIAEKPLQQHQSALVSNYGTPPEVKPAMVAVAKRAIARGEQFTAENVSIEPQGARAVAKFPVYYPEHLWGGVSESDIAAGSMIDARSAGPVSSYPWTRGEGRDLCYAVVNKPLKAGSYISSNVNFIQIKPGQVAPPGAFVASDSRDAYEVLVDLTPGKVLLKSQVKKSP